MKIARFRTDLRPSPMLALVQGLQLLPIAGDIERVSQALRAGKPPVAAGAPLPLAEATLLTPSAPSKIVCVGLNYKQHAAEMNKPLPEEPLFFLKPPSTLTPHGDPIRLPASSSLVHHEAEMALVIGLRARDVSVHEALDHVLGVTCLNDVTARDIQHRKQHYTHAKGFDTFAPCGPWIEVGVDPDQIEVIGRVNGHIRQRGHTSDMIFSAAQLVSFLSHIMTLEPGDLISTGTPSGVGPLVHGDTVEVELNGAALLSNPVLRRA
jgi:2-keto-4-pentenoate hydratase/2-oxohepta-3-ene-1,7-dioic acid hydratase in catechol pathway